MTTTRRLGRLAALLLASSLAFTACARGNDGDTGTTGEGPDTNDEHYTTGVFQKDDGGDPVEGGTLTFADFAENRNMDPSKTIATGFSGGSPLVAVYDQLVRWNTELQDFEPRLAETVEPNEDHSVWTVKLRPGATFSDGTPVNADAVIGSVNYYIAQKGYDLSVIGPMWKGINKVDDTTVEFQLNGPWTSFPSMLGQGMGFIVAPASIQGGTFSKPIGAGAFTFESYKPTEEMVLAANPNYWDGKPHLEKLRFIWVPADDARLETVESGAAQVGLTNNSEITWDLRDKDMNGALEIANQNALLMINNAEGNPGANEKVRQAMGYAIDTDAIIQRARNGKGMPSKALFGPWSKWASGVETLTYDPEKAKTLVEEAKAEGFDGNIQITGLQSSQDTILTVVANLEAAGLTVEQDIQRSVVDYTSKIFIERNYEFGTAGLSISEHDPYQRVYSSMHSESFANVLGVKDAEMDELIVELRGAEGDDRKEVLKRIDERYQEIVPAITFSAGPNFAYWNDNTFGVVASNDGMMSFEKAWIKP